MSRAIYKAAAIGRLRLNDVDPQAWLADMLTRLQDHPASRIDELLPWNWRIGKPLTPIRPPQPSRRSHHPSRCQEPSPRHLSDGYHYRDQFEARLSEPSARLMAIGYSFQDEHINEVIESASRKSGLGTYRVDPRGRDVLRDPKMEPYPVKVQRQIETIRLIGELRRPLYSVFSSDQFGHGALMRFFPYWPA